jgi:hypothetical protein
MLLPFDCRHHEPGERLDQFRLRSGGGNPLVLVRTSLHRTASGGGFVLRFRVRHDGHLVGMKNTDGVGGRPRPPSPRHRWIKKSSRVAYAARR